LQSLLLLIKKIQLLKFYIFDNIRAKDIIISLIEKTNNIPLTFDLFLCIDNKMNSDKIKKFIGINSKSFKFEIEKSFNFGKDLLYFFLKFHNKAKKYKYICNINSNPYKNITYFEEWKNYIYNNLLGNSEIISGILTDFEKRDNLGLVFPERYYKSLFQPEENINSFDLIYLNNILNKINPKIRISSNIMDFPEGNMFWAKVNAIYSIFNLRSKSIFTKKYCLMAKNNLELIWVNLVNLNGYLYKKIFKHL